MRSPPTALLLVLAGAPLAHAQCEPQWHAGYELPGIAGTVHASVIFDDGSGPRLYVGGNFLFAGATKTGCVARWNGAAWEQVGDPFFANPAPAGVLGTVRTLAVYNGQLYAGGQFRRVGLATVNNIAAWDGTTWNPLTGLDAGVTDTGSPPAVNAMTVYDDGAGAKLYLTGQFDDAGGLFFNTSLPVNNIATWDGAAFNYVGDPIFTGLRGEGAEGFALGVHDGRLFVGGYFDSAGTAPDARSVTAWSAAGWEYFGELDGSSVIRSFASFDEDGSGPVQPVLAVAGTLTTVGIGLNGSPGVSVRGVARFDGTAWSSFGPGLPRDPAGKNSVDMTSLVVHSGTLYAAGYPTFDDLGPVNSLWIWNGADWIQAPGGPPRASSAWGGGRIESGGIILTLLSADLDAKGPAAPTLFAGGVFDGFGDVVAANVAAFNETWSPLPAGNAFYTSNASALNWLNPPVTFIVGDEDGAGPRASSLYAYGNFVAAGDVMAPASIVRRDGADWVPLATGPGAPSAAAVFHDDGTGVKLHTVRSYGYVDRWDGAAWAAVATVELPGNVRCAASFDPDAAGPAPASIFIGGSILDEVTGVSGVGRWTGSSWVPVTSADVPGAVNPNFNAHAFIVFQNALYASGSFQSVDQSITYNNAVARWDGASWQIVGEASGIVRAFAEFQGSLYVGGEASSIGGVSGSAGIARYDAKGWHAVGAGVTGSFPNARSQVHSLTVADDGNGPALFLGGPFLTASGVSGTRGVARWDGTAFSPLATGIALRSAGTSPPISIGTTATSIAGINGRVFFAGSFNAAGGVPSSSVAEWGCDQPACRPDFNADGTLNSQDFFDFLTAFFAADPAADFNNDAVINSQDFFDFLAAFFTGC